MGRSGKDLRRTLAPITGVSPSNDAALLRSAIPSGASPPLAQTVKEKAAQLRTGFPKKDLLP